MKKLIIALALVIGMATATFAQQYGYVRPYVRKDGTFVSGHYRTYPDGNFYNNWSTSGNINPFTGNPGYRTMPYYQTTPYYQTVPYYQTTPYGSSWSTPGYSQSWNRW